MRGAHQPMHRPAMTVASTPEAPSCSAGRYAANGVSSVTVISTGGSCTRRRGQAITPPAASPTSTPPRATTRKRRPASPAENVAVAAVSQRGTVGHQGRAGVQTPRLLKGRASARCQSAPPWPSAVSECSVRITANSYRGNDTAELALEDSAGRVIGLGASCTATTLAIVKPGWRRRAEALLFQIGPHLQIGVDRSHEAEPKVRVLAVAEARPPCSAALLVDSHNGSWRNALSRTKWSLSRCCCCLRSGASMLASASACQAR
jgi:hypothetical protein